MAGSLGTLTLDLIAKIGGFTGPLDKASQDTKKRNAEMEKSFRKLGDTIGATFAAAVTASAVGVGALVSKQLDLISDQDDLAKRLRTTVASLATLERAGALSGVSIEQLTGGAQKLDVALGKAAQGSVAQVQAFERLGLSYKTVAELPVDERIAAINQALKDNVPAYERAAVASVLFGAKNAAAFQQLDPETIADARHQAELFGQALSDIDSAKVENAGDAITIFGYALDGVQKQITIELAPVITQLSKDFIKASEDAGGIGPAVRDSVKTAVESVAFLIDAGDGVGRVFKIISAEFDGLVSSAAGSIIAGVYQTLSLLNKLPGVDLSEQLGNLEGNYNKQVDAATDATERMRKALETPLAGTALLDYYKNAQKAAEDAASAGEDEKTQYEQTAEQYAAMVAKRKADAAAAAAAARKSASEAAAAAKKIQDSFNSSETDYERQIELINTTTDKRKEATEVAKLQFEIESGKLVGINDLQQKRLEGLAAELDSLKRIKQANENAAKLAAFSANLNNSNQNSKDGFAQELAGAGEGDKYKERLKEFLAIRQDFNAQMRDLQEQQNSGEISDDLYKSEIEALQKAQEEKLAIQQDYYDKLDEAQSNWLDGVTSAWENYADTASNYSQIANDQVSSQLGSLQSSFGDAISAMVLENQSLGESFDNVVNAMVSSLVKGLADMVAQWLIHEAIKLVIGTAGDTAAVAAASATGTAMAAAYAPAAALASLASFGSNSIPATAGILATTAVAEGVALAGMAHDGIDSVPQDGTWLLQKGERVTTAQTSAKLDKTLADLGSNSDQRNASGRGKSATITQNNYYPTQPDNRTANQSAAALARKQRQASRLG
jgi:lambda family phage tail tape measure protein